MRSLATSWTGTRSHPGTHTIRITVSPTRLTTGTSTGDTGDQDKHFMQAATNTSTLGRRLFM